VTVEMAVKGSREERGEGEKEERGGGTAGGGGGMRGEAEAARDSSGPCHVRLGESRGTDR
jgi:hypothetical protein